MNLALPIATEHGLYSTMQERASIAKVIQASPHLPLFKDATLFYTEALRYAHSLLWPPATNSPESREAREHIGKITPAEAVRGFVSECYSRCVRKPDAVKLIVAENLFNRLSLRERHDILEASPVILHLDNVLMRGHDIGAFRYGISAEDVYLVITALCAFHVTHGASFSALYGMDTHDERNTEGILRIACDTVLAFLTTNMSTEHETSYTHSSHTAHHGAALYSMDHNLEGYSEE